MAQSVAQPKPAQEKNARRRGRPAGAIDYRVMCCELRMEMNARDCEEIRSNEKIANQLRQRNRFLLDKSQIDFNNFVIRALAARNQYLVRRALAHRDEARALDNGPCAA